MEHPPVGTGPTKLDNIIVPNIDLTARWDVEITNGKVTSRTPSSATSCPGLLLPPLCHPHIHLDKPYILTCNRPPSQSHPDYSDLVPRSGAFYEALANTSAAKTRYTPEDLYLRGAQLLAESYSRHGVTAARVFVEVDHAVRFKTVEAAVRLKRDFEHLVRIQICVFAQDPIFSGDHGDENRALLEQALDRYAEHIEALGTTPYVEQRPKAHELDPDLFRHANIEWAIQKALAKGLHLDLHLDYDLDHSHTTVRKIVGEMKDHDWVARVGHAKVVTIGHCTRLTTQKLSDLRELASLIKTPDLPIHFVGLPTSDLFMMGRSSGADPEDSPHSRPRGTLQVLSMIKDLGLNAAIGVNNVGNAFTPYGDGDPLQLACWGTGIYQAGTPADAKLLYECVSDRAQRAIGLLPATTENKQEGEVLLPGLLIRNVEDIKLPGKLEDGQPFTVPARPRLSVKDVVWDPPDSALRRVVR